MLDARVLALGVLPDGHEVDPAIERVVTDERLARAHIGIEIELPESERVVNHNRRPSPISLAQRQIQRLVTFPYRRRQRPLQTDLVLVHRVDGALWDLRFALWPHHRRHVD